MLRSEIINKLDGIELPEDLDGEMSSAEFDFWMQLRNREAGDRGMFCLILVGAVAAVVFQIVGYLCDWPCVVDYL